MGKNSIIALVKKDFSPKYKLVGEIPEDFTDFMQNLNGKIDFITYKNDTDKSQVKNEFLDFVNEKYGIKDFEKYVVASQENLKNSKWHNWHLPFIPRYWKKDALVRKLPPELLSAGSTMVGILSETMPNHFYTGISGLLFLLGKYYSERNRRAFKKENEKDLKYLLEIQELEKDLESLKINVIQDKEAQKFINAYKNMELPDGLKNIKGLSKENIVPISSINNHLQRIYWKH